MIEKPNIVAHKANEVALRPAEVALPKELVSR